MQFRHTIDFILLYFSSMTYFLIIHAAFTTTILVDSSSVQHNAVNEEKKIPTSLKSITIFMIILPAASLPAVLRVEAAAAEHGGLREYLARTTFASCVSCFIRATS